MDSVYLGSPPPSELKIAWQCERFHCLPDSGAYFDQDYALIVRMTALMNIHSVLQKWVNSDSKNIHKLTDGDRKILRYLKDIGILFN